MSCIQWNKKICVPSFLWNSISLFNRYLTISFNILPSENFTMLIPFCGADIR